MGEVFCVVSSGWRTALGHTKTDLHTNAVWQFLLFVLLLALVHVSALYDATSDNGA